MQCQSIIDCILKGGGWKWPEVPEIPEVSKKLPEVGLSNDIEQFVTFHPKEDSACVILSPKNTPNFELATHPCVSASRILCFKGMPSLFELVSYCRCRHLLHLCALIYFYVHFL